MSLYPRAWAFAGLILIVAASLIVLGYLPPRGVVTGYIRLCQEPGRCNLKSSAPHTKLVFERLDGDRKDVIVTLSDENGHYTATLAAGRYHVQTEYLVQPEVEGHAGGFRRTDFPEGPALLTVQTGQRLEVDYGFDLYAQ
jgi:hypothetical protein